MALSSKFRCRAWFLGMMRGTARFATWRSARHLVICFWFYGTSFAAEPKTGTLVVPNFNASGPGSVSGTPLSAPDDFYSQTYDASQFTSMPQGGNLMGLSFRSQEGPLGGVDATYSHFEVLLATYPHPISQVPRYLTETLAKQLFPNAATVFSKDNVRFSGAGSVSPEVPAPFEIHLQFDRPFYYDPRVGNLLMYLQCGSALTRGELDFENRLPNPVGYAINAAAAMQGLPASQGALVVQFDYTLVPEPSVLALIVIGTIGFGPVQYVARKRTS